VAGLPSSGIVAITGNLTVTHPNAAGFVYLGPSNPGSAMPASSTINFPAGDTRANNVVVQVAADGTLWADYWASGSAANTIDVILDVSGYFTNSGGVSFHTIDPARILDSRNGTGGISNALAANTPATITVWGHGGVPSGAVAIAANLTDVPAGTPGFAAVGPVVTANTQFSNLNFPGGDVRANGVTTPLAGNGTLQLVYGASGGSADLILDVCGYYGP
jgi:hypothetical protein